MITRLEDSSNGQKHNQRLTTQMTGGKFDYCLLFQDFKIHRISIALYGSVLRAAYQRQRFTIPGIEGVFMRRKD